MKSEKLKMGQRGFTLIELLIVIALIGILAVALLSAINPLEQLRKGRDSARKADAAELLNSIERFYASFQCYPWDTDCDSAGDVADERTPSYPIFASGGTEELLITRNELKREFQSRLEGASNPSYRKLFVMEVDWSTDNPGEVRVCFEPESTTGRNGGLGRVFINADGIWGTDNPVETLGTACPDYTAADAYADATCYICVPQ